MSNNYSHGGQEQQPGNRPPSQTQMYTSDPAGTLGPLQGWATDVPPPKLELEFRMSARLTGQVCRVRLRNEGVRDLSVVEGGEWVAGFGRGTVRSGGHDLQVSQPPERTRTRVDMAFELGTSDNPPAILEMRTRGFMSYDPGSLERIVSGREEDLSRYAFRMVMTLRTEDARYSERVNLGLWLGCGVWKGEDLVLE
ncbi:uncharacterized protein DNG_03075 [Cephalotrichum gorgonifer]|uniref:Uncharacterized protein n=1 Tax=Cephalotrichum gorgonifer TaxID=2041049 RepID=A0AAE8ST80_9PEZI|nr:uncharacterized protein DNG_03075 [Cephalotrichum gorgonifer]